MNWEKLKFWNNYDDVIEFYCHEDVFGAIPEPKPAQKNLPEWFKNLAPISNYEETDSFGNPVMSAKKCLPLLDGMSMGFTMPLMGEIRVRTNHNCSQMEITNPPNFVVAEFHKAHQVGGQNKLKSKQGDPVKFINRWAIKTAPGWSTLFIPPMNVFNSPFTCLSALVDTDKYPKEVNFPAVWTLPDANICLKAGTPLVTAIPINREVFKAFKKNPKIRPMNAKDLKIVNTIQKAQSIRNHVYTEELRVKK